MTDTAKFKGLQYDFETAFDEDALLHIGKVEFTDFIIREYERQTGESCVYWHSKDDAGNYTTLPRPYNYETEGYSDSFWKWLGVLEHEAFNAGATTTKDVCLYIIGRLTKPNTPPDYVWVATEETDDGEPPLCFFTDEEEARSWLRDLFEQHVKYTMIPREHFIWHNEDGLHQVYDGDIKWGLSVRKVRPAFDPINP